MPACIPPAGMYDLTMSARLMYPTVFGHLRLTMSQHAWLIIPIAATANITNAIPGTIYRNRSLQATKIIAEMTTAVTIATNKQERRLFLFVEPFRVLIISSNLLVAIQMRKKRVCPCCPSKRPSVNPVPFCQAGNRQRSKSSRHRGLEQRHRQGSGDTLDGCRLSN